ALESDIQHEDRVELFFATNSSAEADMSGAAAAPPCCYYGLEIDSGGRVMDFSGTFGQSIDRAWTMSSLETVGSRTQTGYRVEGRMQLQQLRDMDVLDELGFMRVGVYRGEYSGDPKADSPKWISWIDPGTELPNFHTIAAFGVFELR
ncbi:MAG: endoxylanase, partial [Gammaproteobacteria bacterium]|nr:endoxylanase [Gammaproteobacteria bacterium]